MLNKFFYKGVLNINDGPTHSLCNLNVIMLSRPFCSSLKSLNCTNIEYCMRLFNTKAMQY